MQRDHYRYLDGLRGLAIIGVVLVHVSQSIPGLAPWLFRFADYGSHGVQLFFVVSGFTLMLTYRGRSFDARTFYIRRFFRIAPMFYAAALFYLALGEFTALRFATRGQSPLDVLLTFAFLHGWSPSAYNRVVPGGWSIAAEAMFYATFPLILLLAARGRTLLLAATAVAFVAAGVLKLVLMRVVPGDPDTIAKFAFFFWAVQFPAFLTGCAVATLVRPDAGATGVGRVLATGAGIAILIVAALPVLKAVYLADVLFGLLIAGATLRPPAFLTGRGLTRLGQVSFSVYLVHFLFAALADRAVPTLSAAIGPAATLLVLFVLVLAAATAVSLLSFRWVELPMIELGRRLSRRRADPPAA